MPHKGAVLPLLDEVDEVVRLSGSVNTIVMDGSELRGYNTDGDGFVDACREAGIELGGSRVLLIGAGRVAAAIAVSLRGEGVNELRIVDREEDHAAELMGRLRGMKGFVRVRTYLLDELDEVATGANVIINATPLGMRDADPLPIPVEYLDEGKGVCDVVYRTSEETELVRQARERGARVASGRRLLLYQGVRQQRLWTGREPDVRVMDDAIS
jgi:shikimate dehydrogenase